jgi:hypothetical protein
MPGFALNFALYEINPKAKGNQDMHFAKAIVLTAFISIANCAFQMDVSKIHNGDIQDIKQCNYMYALKTIPEPWWYIVEENDSSLIYRTILFSKDTKYIGFGVDTLQPKRLNGQLYWQSRKLYFYKNKYDKYCLNDLEMDCTKEPKEIDRIINMTLLWDIRDSMAAKNGDSDKANKLFKEGKQFEWMSKEKFIDKIMGITKGYL